MFFARTYLDLTLEFSAFISQLQRRLEEFRIGVLRMEEAEEDTGKMVLTISEDADCSGLPAIGEMVCNYDEGFLSGLLTAYTGKPYSAEEINTSHGRKAGDAYIQNFVDAVRKHFRSNDTFARVRDDKFCLLLSGKVKHLVERKMGEIAVAFQRDEDRLFKHRCNFNFGIVEVDGETNTMTLDELLERAEVSIRVAKRQRWKMEFDF